MRGLQPVIRVPQLRDCINNIIDPFLQSEVQKGCFYVNVYFQCIEIRPHFCINFMNVIKLLLLSVILFLRL